MSADTTPGAGAERHCLVARFGAVRCLQISGLSPDSVEQ